MDEIEIALRNIKEGLEKGAKAGCYNLKELATINTHILTIAKKIEERRNK